MQYFFPKLKSLFILIWLEKNHVLHEIPLFQAFRAASALEEQSILACTDIGSEVAQW